MLLLDTISSVITTVAELLVITSSDPAITIESASAKEYPGISI